MFGRTVEYRPFANLGVLAIGRWELRSEFGATVRRMQHSLGIPVVTIASAVLVFSVAAALGVNASTGVPESNAFVDSGPWAVWRMVAATASVLFIGLFLAAVRVLRAAAEWGLDASASKVRTYLVCALAGTGVLVIGRFIVGSGTPDLPVRYLNLRVGSVLFTALLAGIPFVVLVWLAHDTCHLLRRQIETLPALALKPEVPSTDPSDRGKPQPHREVISRLLRVWDLLGLCVGAFAIGVVAAIVTASSLRAALLEAQPDRAHEFPAVNVLYYGILFAALASVLNLPLVAAWRRSARSMVDRTYPLPPDGQPTDEWLAARARLEALLHLDVSLLRNPLTALTVLSPLLTSSLAAFIPQVGGP